MQVGKNELIYDGENPRLLEKKKISTEIANPRRNRRPLGDICNILPTEKDPNEKVQDKKRPDNKDDLVLCPSDTTQAKKQEIICHIEVDDTDDVSESKTLNVLETKLNLRRKETEITLKEKLYGLTEYVDDVFNYLRNLEKSTLIGKKHLEGLEMTEKMRSILVDWMMEVHSHFNLCQETLELSIFILDRYTEMKRNLNKRNAQLIGLVCLFLAAKYEETEPLELCDIIFVSDSAVSQKDIIRAERIIIKAIEYNLSRPLTVHFVRRYSKVGGVTPMEHAYAMYFCEAAMLEYSLCSVYPSMLAAAAIFLALCVSKEAIDIKIWDDTLIKYSTYRLSDFYHLLPRIAVAVQLCTKSKLEAVRKKYSIAERYYVSMMPGVQPTHRGSVIEHFCQ